MQSQNVTFELRNGHGDGHTDVVFTADGSAILTGGSDGECRLWQKEDEFQDCESFPVGSTVYAIAVRVSPPLVAPATHSVFNFASWKY